jgi:hypothetical protein
VFGCEKKDDFPVLKGSYLGQKPPGMKTELFATGLLSANEYSPLGITVTPDGKEIYYTLFKGPGNGVIMCTKIEKGKWIKPQKVPFSGKYNDWDINLSSDGNRLYFSSMRPVLGSNNDKKDANIWFVKKTGANVWSKPMLLDIPEDSFLHEVHPTVAQNHNIYFFTMVKGRSSDIFYSKFINNKYGIPCNLGSSINTEYNEADPFIAADESYIIFQSKRPGGFGKNDLYISFRTETESWCNAINMGDMINTEESDKGGRVTHDGKYFIFSRTKEISSISDFYWIDAKIIENLKPTDIK